MIGKEELWEAVAEVAETQGRGLETTYEGAIKRWGEYCEAHAINAEELTEFTQMIARQSVIGVTQGAIPLEVLGTSLVTTGFCLGFHLGLKELGDV